MNYQSLTEFIKAPFGEPNQKKDDYERKYRALKSQKKIWIEGYTIIEDNYLLHIKVGSDTDKLQTYDVILLFFTDNEKIKKQIGLNNYFVKFFSNSPSFIYQYAALYKLNGFLIDMLYDKLDELYSDALPEKANKDMKLSYDKSIYAACRFLQDDKRAVMNKFGIVMQKKKTPEKFFSDIRNFKDVKFTSEINILDKKINKELDKNNPKGSTGSRPIRSSGKVGKVTAKKSTMKDPGVHIVKKKRGTMKSKTSAKKSTFRNRP